VGTIRYSIFLDLVLLIATASSVISQSQQPTDEPIKLGTQLVVVDAQVLNKKSGVVVNGLAREHFTLYEDGVKQQITHFSQDKLPLSIVLLLDVSGSVQPVIDQVRDQGLRALNELKPGDEVALMAFGMWPTLLQGFTKDRQLIAERIAAIELMGPWIKEATYIHEAVYSAARHLAGASNPDSRRIIVIITDNLSNQPFAQGHSKAVATEALLESGVVLSGLVVGDFNAVVDEYKKKGFIVDDSIGNYVDETGGIVLRVGSEDVVAKLARLIERMRTRYSLGYTPRNEKRDGKFRKIKLSISPEIERRERGIALVARKGYYARGPDSAKPVSSPPK
jgi:VWFA-related protein